ncbi:hypothetical protein ACQJBY_038166 [Aegilops geniculata]
MEAAGGRDRPSEVDLASRRRGAPRSTLAHVRRARWKRLIWASNHGSDCSY